MKLVLRQYLGDLRERGELDAILPDLLSELGFNVLSRPSRGTRQNGVDVAAVGPDGDDGGRRKLFLFAIKPGDLHRRDWDDGSPQAVRPSLNEIRDAYVSSRVPQQYRNIPIAICLCMGGEMHESVQGQWAGYVAANSTENICYREWNGDKLAELLLSGVLRQELLDNPLRADFQKAVAMVDHPDISYRFFVRLVKGLLYQATDDREQLTRLRQTYICLWVLYVWAREANNLEAPFRISEYAVLQMWNICRSLFEGNSGNRDPTFIVLNQAVTLHFSIADSLLIEKFGAYSENSYALSAAVASQSSVDVNLSVFEQFGRLCLYGIWQHFQSGVQSKAKVSTFFEERRNQALQTAIRLINSNLCLRSPIRDDFMIEISLLLMLSRFCGAENSVKGYLEDLVQRLQFSITRRGAYPVVMTEYHYLVAHPLNRSDKYFERFTRASVLYPLLIAWLDEMDLSDSRETLVSCIRDTLAHTTHQIWVPDENTEGKIWVGDMEHGTAITGLPLCESTAQYRSFLSAMLEAHTAFESLSAIKLDCGRFY